METTLQFSGITKFFPGVKALDNISFSAQSGEVLSRMGENGAGKSTLRDILPPLIEVGASRSSSLTTAA